MIRDFRLAFRALARTPGFTATAVFLLSLGIGAATALWSVVRGTLLEPWPYAGARRIVSISASYPRSAQPRSGTFSAVEASEILSRTDVFDATLAGTARDVNLTTGSSAERVHAVAMTASAFPLLGVGPVLGRVFGPRDDRPGAGDVVVLGNRIWRERFGADPAVVGRSVSIEGVPCTVVGVMPPRFLWWDAQLYFPLKLDSGDRDPRRRYSVQGRLRPGTTPRAAEASLDVLARGWERREGAAHPEYAGMSFRVAFLLDDVLRDLRPILWALLGASVLLLAVACANLGNLLLARAGRRAREIAIRRALGAGTPAILRGFLAETALLGAAGVVGGGIAARASLRELVSLVPYGFIPAESQIRLDAGAFGVATALAGAAAVALAAAVATRTPRESAVVSSPRSTRGSPSRLFVGVQAAVAVVLVAGAVSLAANVRRALREPIGARTAGAATLRVALPAPVAPDAAGAAAVYDRLLAAGSAIPSVRASGAVSQLPLAASPSRRFRLEGESEDSAGVVFDADILAVAGRYFAAARVPLKEGRELEPRDGPEAPRVAVVNETLARRFWPGRDPVGRRVREEGSGAWRTVVGVVGDVRQSIDLPQRPQLYLPAGQTQTPVRTMAVVLETARPSETIAAARRAFAEIDPSIAVFAARPIGDVVRDALGGRRLALVLTVFFAGAVFLLSIAGVEGAAALGAAARTREIGIRTALGIPRSAVVALLVREAAGAAGAGAAAGVLAGAAVTAWLAAAIPGFRLSLLPAASAAAGVLSCAAIAAWVPARRAARVDPTSALRAD